MKISRYLLCLTLALTMVLPTACTAEGVTYTTTGMKDIDLDNIPRKYQEFFEYAELTIPIPGLKEYFIPQGVCHLPQEDWIIVAGYRSDGGRSALICLDRTTGELVKEVHLNQVDGSAYKGHAGGVCATDKHIYVSNASHLYRISLETFRALPESSTCAFEEAIPVPVNSSYCAYSDGVVWVGEFQYGADYTTDATHNYTHDGGVNKAWTCGYIITDETENGLKADVMAGGVAVPDYILSTPASIQGCYVTPDAIYMSKSYGRNNASAMYKYENVMKNDPDATVQLHGREIPLWVLHRSVMEKELTMPPMSEGICMVENGLYVLFESAAIKYSNCPYPLDEFPVLKGF